MAKVTVLGIKGAGKTSLVNRILNVAFSPREEETIGGQRRSINYNYDTLNFEEVGGKKSYQYIVPFTLKKCEVILYCVDLTSIDSNNTAYTVEFFHEQSIINGKLEQRKLNDNDIKPNKIYVYCDNGSLEYAARKQNGEIIKVGISIQDMLDGKKYNIMKFLAAPSEKDYQNFLKNPIGEDAEKINNKYSKLRMTYNSSFTQAILTSAASAGFGVSANVEQERNKQIVDDIALIKSHSPEAIKILVGTKTDGQNQEKVNSELTKLKNKFGFSAAHSTSAKTDAGIDDLRKKVFDTTFDIALQKTKNIIYDKIDKQIAKMERRSLFLSDSKNKIDALQDLKQYIAKNTGNVNTIDEIITNWEDVLRFKIKDSKKQSADVSYKTVIAENRNIFFNRERKTLSATQIFINELKSEFGEVAALPQSSGTGTARNLGR